MSTRPRKGDYPTWWSWKQADRAWLRAHGGRLWVTLLLAVGFGALTGSAVMLIVLVVAALGLTAYVRSRP